MKKSFVIGAILIFPLFAVVFQNCGTTHLNKISDTYVNSGLNGKAPNPNVKLSDYCTDGEKLAIWSDSDNDGEKNELLGYVVAHEGKEKAATNYKNYINDAKNKNSSDKSKNSHIYFYIGPKGLSLNFVHSNLVIPSSLDWNIFVKNNNFADQILFNDDSKKITTDSRTSDATKYNIQSKTINTLFGGVIGPLTGKDIQVKLNINDYKGQSQHVFFHSSNEDIFSVPISEKNNKLIITFDSSHKCK